MSTLFYNGVHLECVETVSCTRRAEYDSGNTYLWTRWRIHVRAIYNPAQTSYIGDDTQTLTPQSGLGPYFTDGEIRHALLQPRRKLIYTAAGPPADPGDLPPGVEFVTHDDPPPPAEVPVDGLAGAGGSQIILQCPPVVGVGPPVGVVGPANYTGGTADDEYLTDANNGPTPVFCNVRAMHALRTWEVDYCIEACVNECYAFYETPAILVSHRWQQSHDIDRMAFTTRRVRGHAIFRSDLLLKRNVRPDDFRKVLFHPIPDNCVRENVRVTAEEDGNRLSYSFTDREVSHNVLSVNVARLEGVVHVHQGIPGAGSSLWQILTSAIGIGAKVGAARRGGGSVAGVAGSILGDIAGVVDGVLPKLSITLVFRAWGNRAASQTQLINVITRAMMYKFPAGFRGPGGSGPGKTPNFTRDSETVIDCLGRYVEVRQTFTCDLKDRLKGAIASDVGTLYPTLTQDDIGGTDGIATTANKPGRAGLWDSPHRGTYLESCVAQVLTSPCRLPGEPLARGSQDLPLPVPGVA